ncbi:MAG: hypothetical protein ACJASI_002775 [Glaciecola sp.]|jgi:hypothetical protein
MRLASKVQQDNKALASEKCVFELVKRRSKSC